MAQIPGKNDAEIGLSVFAGLVTNQDPIALPIGASPDCSDVTFLPGGVSSRPCLKKVFAAHIYPNTTMVYGKSYLDPKGVIRNLYQYSNGGMTVEFPLVTPGVETALLDNNGNPVFLPPGSLMKSITAFGREYLACSDGSHGADVALQYDGTYLDRVTQDGPGSCASVSSIALASVAMVASGAGVALTVTSITTSGFIDVQVPDGSGGFTDLQFYSTLTVTVTAGASGLGPSTPIVIAGNAQAAFNTSNYVIQVNSDTEFVIGGGIQFGSPLTGAGGTATPTGGVTLARTNNSVACTTAAAHNLQPGFKVQVAGIAASAIGGGIASIVIDNENLPGIATITTNSPHGLQPSDNVSITGVQGVSVGTSVASIQCVGQVVTVVMTASTGLTPGGLVTLSGFANAAFNTTAIVLSVLTTTAAADTFTFALNGQANIAPALTPAGAVALNWPIPDTPSPTFFEVQSAPTATTFQVAINYCDGSWHTGTVTFAWDGTFYVLTVPSATTFTYQQNGPNSSTSSVGTVTPFGQAAPGQKQMQVLFLTRQGYLTAPCPPVKFVANGGQYYRVTNIPIGPANVIARILAFTGADGAYFFYIPAPPQVNGLLVGTATQINDNTTESILLDFGDPTLLSAIGISTQGNNPANQVVLDGALGFGYYGSRLFTYGQRNVIQNLLNMTMDGGHLPSAPTQPTGWTYSGTTGAIVTGHFGDGWQLGNATLSQSMYEDYSGAPVASPKDKYTVRAWLSGAGTVTFTITSASAGFASTAVLHPVGAGFVQADFDTAMPSPIPADLTLSFSGTATLIIDDISLIFSQNPYLRGMYGSYGNNPEAFDGVSGIIGPVNDTHPVFDLGIIRDNLYMLTQDPGGRLHETAQAISEPADWVVSEIASNCGAVSTFSLTRSQADDSTASGGEEYFSWMSFSGYRIFGGEEPDKISQEIQRPEGQQFPGAPVDLSSLNTSSLTSIWSLNDPVQKMIYLGVPIKSIGSAAAPDTIFVLSYLNLDSASAIVNNPPVHKSLSGKLVATDMGRKWAPWQLPMNGAALMYRGAANPQPCFFAGNGVAPNHGGIGQHANAYTLNPQLYTDDDYGLVSPYYITAALPDKETEQEKGLGGVIKMCSFLRAMFYGVGYMNITILYNYLNNQWPLTGQYLMSLHPLRGAPWPCGQAEGDCFFIKFSSSPNTAGATANPTTDNQFSLSRLSVWIRKNARYLDAGVWP